MKPFVTHCCIVNNECICAGNDDECTIVDDTSDVEVLAFGEVYDDFLD